MQVISRKAIGALGAAVLAWSALAAAPASAGSGGEAPPSTAEPDRVIYVDGPIPEIDPSAKVIQSDANAEVTLVEQADLPVVPAPGETVRIVYTNAITEITTEPTSTSIAAAASCTKSITAETPYKTSAGNAVGRGRGTISSGCSSGGTLRVYLYSGLVVKASAEIGVPNNGSTFSRSVASACANSDRTSHYTYAVWASGGSARSTSATLTCGYGFWG